MKRIELNKKTSLKNTLNSKSNKLQSHSKWTFEENKLLLNIYHLKKNRWKEISKEIPFRSDNSIKNQFFALVRKGLRKAYKAIGLTDNTNKVNTIKPKVLLDFFDSHLIYKTEDYSEELEMSKIIEDFALNKRYQFLDENERMKEIIIFFIKHLNEMKFFNQQLLYKK